MEKGKTKYRVCAVLLSLCMLLSLLPVSGLATEVPVTFTQVDNTVLPDEVALENPNPSESADTDVPADDEVVRAIILLEKASVLDAGYSSADLAKNASAMAYKDELILSQDAMIRRIETLAGAALEVKAQLTIGVNGICVSVPYGDIAAIEKVPGVREVYLEQIHYPEETAEPDTVTSGEMVNFYSAWADGYTGAGGLIAIVDTGIDRDHPSFSEEGFRYGLATTAAKQGKTIGDYDLLTLEDVAEILPELNVYEIMDGAVTAEDLYTNGKIPFGFNYIMETIEYGCDTISGEHGCHVAGIAAANTYVPTVDADGDTYLAKQAQGVTGVAPDAQIIVMKVFSDGWGAYESDYMLAIEDAVMLGCDSVNLSLGSASAGNTYGPTTMQELFATLMASDTVMTNSGGNNGAWADSEINGIGLNRTEDIRTNTGGSPGSYTNAFTIASVDNIALTGIVGDYNGYVAGVNDTGSSYGANLFKTLDTSEDGSGTEYPYVFLGDPETGEGIYGLEGDFDNVDLTGKIVLISRGNSSFFEKANLAVENGAVATVIYNNVDGSISMNLTGYLHTNPAVSMDKADSDAIFSASVKNEQTGLWEGTVIISSVEKTVYGDTENLTMSSFSSWGCGDDLGLKPEITSPGGNIYSTVDGGGYAAMSGTSMSAPSTAGSVAVVAQYIKENGLAEKTGLSVRELAIALMMSTADPITDGNTGLYYSPRQQGSGLTQVYEAVTTPAYLLVGEKEGNDGKVKLELGDDPSRTGVYTGSFSVNNITDEALVYSFDGSVFTNAVETYDDVDYMSKSGRGLNPTVDFETDAQQSYVYDINEDGSVDELDALVLLKVANDTAPALDADDANLYDFDRDGAITTTDAQLFLAALKGDTAYLDTTASTYVVPAGASIEVNFTITLSDEDKAYFDTYYPNGGYVDGFLFVNSENGDEKQLSVPVLAFYGNWSDASMYEHWTLLEDQYNENATPSYVTDAYTNYFSVKLKGSTSATVYYANSWAADDEYIADRNAINNRATLYSATNTLLRNAANKTVTIRNAETGEEYFTKSLGTGIGAYYYSSGGYWSGLASTSTIDWKLTDSESKRLEEGTKIEVEIRAVTEYNWDRENGVVVGELGEGAYWFTTMTVDNTAPEATSIAATTDSITGERSLKVKVLDNRYTAAVLLLSSSGSVLARKAVNQTELGVESTVDFDLSEVYTNGFYVYVIDYAGNASTYEVAIGGEVKIPDTNAVLSVALEDSNGQWFADLDVDEQTVTAKTETAGEVSILSTTRGADGVLYAASSETMEENGQKYLVSSLYTVNETDYSLTRLSETLDLGYTDMTWMPTVNGGSLIGSYGSYVWVIDAATGEPLIYWNSASYIGSTSSIMALAYVETQENATYGNVDVFLMMDTNGIIYQAAFTYNASTGQYTVFTPSALVQISNTYGLFYGSSMYFEDGMLYVSALSQSGETLYSQLLSADLTADTVWFFDRGQLSTAPVCIYDAAAKETGEAGEENLNALQPLGEPAAVQTVTGDLEIEALPMEELGW